jgi:LPXTG-motif cell wall-anchored protein
MSRPNRLALAAAATAALSAAALATGIPVAHAGIVPTVPLATSASYSVLAASTVSNTNPSVIGQSVGLSPGTAIVGFPPGIVLAPGTIQADGPTTQIAQNDLTTAYVNAANRPVEFTQTNPDLVGQTLIPGVYAASSKAPLGLSGQLVLDGQNNPNAVFIFQTDSSLITSSGSTVELINGATECNVFWQVGSSATLGTGSVFVGNILALTSITVQSGVVVHGRALARNGAVTLDNDVFTQPSCTPVSATSPPATTTTTATTPASSTTIPGGTATTAGDTTGTGPGTGTGAGAPGDATPVSGAGDATPGAGGAGDAGGNDLTVTSTPFDVTGLSLPSTGQPISPTTTGLAGGALLIGILAVLAVRRRQPA